MLTDLAGRRLLVAGDPRPAAVLAGEASVRGAVVVLATDAHGAGNASADGTSIRYDGTSEADIDRAMDAALDASHGFDGLIFAIEADTMPPLDEGDLSSWERCVTQPLRAAFWLLRRGVDELLAAGRGGPIVVVVAGGRGDSGPGSAWILESSLVSLARSIAKEYGRRAITCNVVAGGLAHGADRAAVEAALFLASPAAAFVTGECLQTHP